MISLKKINLLVQIKKGVLKMVKKIIFFIFSLFLVIIGIKNDLIKQKIAKTTPKKQEIKPERVS